MAGEFDSRMRQRIDTELARIERSIASVSGEGRPQELETSGDNTPLSDDADVMRALEEDWSRADHLDRLVGRARELREAGRRLDAGRFGLCTECGGRISRIRLLAIPEAALCVGCQQRAEPTKRSGVPDLDVLPAA